MTSTDYDGKEKERSVNRHSMGEPLKHAERRKPDIRRHILFSLHDVSQMGKFINTIVRVHSISPSLLEHAPQMEPCEETLTACENTPRTRDPSFPQTWNRSRDVFFSHV